MFNRYVFDNQDNLVNLTTKKVLPKNSSLQVLKENFFLEGQEEQCLNSALFSPSPFSIGITLIPTWECNLRCSHCFVLHELLKKDKNVLDADKLLDFISRYKQKYQSIERIAFYFLGGEPALRAKENSSLISRIRSLGEGLGFEAEFSATSNGVSINQEILEFYSSLDNLAISVDGNKETHDAQRKSPDQKSPFESTMKTIRVLIKCGMRDKLRVQASMNQENFEEEIVLGFYKEMLMAGVKMERIHFGLNAPTNHNPEPSEKFIEASKSKIYSRACCKYRFMNNFVIDSKNNIYCDYFNTNPENMLGSLSDSISKIEESHKKIISKSMQVLNDDKCKKCPVIGACWGWCCNLVGLVRPSDHCDQEGLIEKVTKSAESGSLVELLNLSTQVCENK